MTPNAMPTDADIDAMARAIWVSAGTTNPGDGFLDWDRLDHMSKATFRMHARAAATAWVQAAHGLPSGGKSMSEWKKDKYGGVSAMLAGTMLRIAVSHDACRSRDSEELPYIVTVFGGTLKHRAATLDEGKKLAVDGAREILAKATAGASALAEI